MSIFPWFAAGFGGTFVIGAMAVSPSSVFFIVALIIGLLFALLGVSQKPTNKIWLEFKNIAKKRSSISYHPYRC